jgi:hypothetical protein
MSDNEWPDDTCEEWPEEEEYGAEDTQEKI